MVQPCPICGRPAFGMLQIDAWGNRYHMQHASEYKPCSACQRLVCDKLTGGGVTYSDGRLVCSLCRRTAIDTKEQAKPHVEAMAAWLCQNGFAFQNLVLRIELVGQMELMAKTRGPASPYTQGIITKSWLTQNGRTTRRVDGVAILAGLPRQMLNGVAVHELGHAWLFLEGADSLEPRVEEGFCNTLSFLYHSEVSSDEARFCLRVIQDSPDPIYGDGFRLVHAAVQRWGLRTIADYLKQYRQLPPA